MIGANKSIMGYHLGRLKGAEHKIKSAIIGLNKFIEKGDINPIISKVFSYQDTAKSHQYIQDRKNFGKVLIDFSEI